MHRRFLEWIKEIRDGLEEKGIMTDHINVTSNDVPNPSTIVDHSTQYCMGRVSVWETGQMDVEVLHIDTEKTLLYEHYNLEKKNEFSKALRKYFGVLCSKNEDEHEKV